MAQHGHRRDAELNAMCDYCKWLFIAVSAHAEDSDLQMFTQRCRMITLRELCREKEVTGKQIVQDRIADCNECREMSGRKMCFDPDTGKYLGCRWYKGKEKVEFVKNAFGEQATSYLEKYKDVKQRRKT